MLENDVLPTCIGSLPQLCTREIINNLHTINKLKRCRHFRQSRDSLYTCISCFLEYHNIQLRTSGRNYIYIL